MLEAAKEMGTRLTLRLGEVEHYGSTLADKTRNLILRLTAKDIKEFLAGKKWPPMLRHQTPDLVEIELNHEVMAQMEEV